MNKIFEKAIKCAEKLPNQKQKMVAIITDKKGKILSIGANSFEKTHPTQAYYAQKVGNKHRIFLHAEMQAIIRLNKVFFDLPYAIYIVRINKEGKTLLAKPCKICQKAIKDVGIKKVYHT